MNALITKVKHSKKIEYYLRSALFLTIRKGTVYYHYCIGKFTILWQHKKNYVPHADSFKKGRIFRWGRFTICHKVDV